MLSIRDVSKPAPTTEPMPSRRSCVYISRQSRMKNKRFPFFFEFAVASNFSFLRGASHPEELMLQAAHIGLDGIGLCDRNSVAGVVRAHLIKREKELSLAYHRDRPAWGRLCRLLTRGNLRAQKGDCILYLNDLLEHSEGLELVVMEISSRDSPPSLLTKKPGHVA